VQYFETWLIFMP